MEGPDRGQKHRTHREEEEGGKDEEDQGKEHLYRSAPGEFLSAGPPLDPKLVRDRPE